MPYHRLFWMHKIDASGYLASMYTINSVKQCTCALYFYFQMLGNHLSSSARQLTSKYQAVGKSFTFARWGHYSCLQSYCEESVKQVSSTWQASTKHLAGT